MHTVSEHVEKAVEKLGYVTADCIGEIAHLIQENQGIHPHALSTKFRKTGPQLTSPQKRDLGINVRAFFSFRALETLTDKGRATPLKAHEITMLHAVFANFRESSIVGSGNWADYYKASGSHSHCEGCRRYKGLKIGAAEALALPPADCTEEVCSLWVMPYRDFLKGVK